MKINFIKASDKLKSALERIKNRFDEVENRPDKMGSYTEELMNLYIIQNDLKWVELYFIEMENEKL